MTFQSLERSDEQQTLAGSLRFGQEAFQVNPVLDDRLEVANEPPGLREAIVDRLVGQVAHGFQTLDGAVQFAEACNVVVASGSSGSRSPGRGPPEPGEPSTDSRLDRWSSRRPRPAVGWRA